MKERKQVILHQDENTVKNLCKSMKINEITARLLVNRGICGQKQADEFLNISLDNFHSAFIFSDMLKCVERIKKALKNNEKIVIYGDYDVDGITSSSLLASYFISKNANVKVYIPDRFCEGYGLNIKAIEEFSKDNVDLIITVDCGITAVEEAVKIKELGMDLIITDHHTCKDELPDCVGIINPKKTDEKYPFKEFAGVGVAFKLICALESEQNLPKLFNCYSDLVCIGTISDIMSLTGENRIITSVGLQQMNDEIKNYGIKATLEKAGFDKSKKITSSVISYTIAPRINAAGRIGDAERAVKMFLSKSYEEAKDYAEILCEENRKRQQTELEIYKQAEEMLKDYDFEKNKVIVLESENWHHGIIGIVASKLCETYYLPVLLISPDEDGIGKGSGRSVAGFSLFEALSECSDLLLKFGGHELAAGFSIKKENIKLLAEKINSIANEKMTKEILTPKVFIDCEIKLKDISMDLIKQIQRLEPFGQGNPTPVFAIKGLRICQINPLTNNKHIQVVLKDAEDRRINAVYFNKSTYDFNFDVDDIVDIALNIDINIYRNKENLVYIIKDVSDSDIFKKETYSEMIEDAFAGDFDKINVKYIPDRDDIGFVYKAVLNFSSQNNNLMPIKSIIKYIINKYNCDMNYFKFMVCIKVLEDVNLIKYKSDFQALSFEAERQLKKVNLFDSKLWSGLQHRLKEV